MKRILIVEDDPQIAGLINRALQEAGHETLVAFDGATGLTLFESFSPQLVITDQIMPKMTGLELCQKIRTKDKTTPIVILTALSSTEDVVMGLDFGADDYLVKPFRLPELLARIRVLLRRTQQVGSEAISKVGDLTVNHDSREVFRQKISIKLTATEFRLLEFLIRNKGRLKTRMEILEEVWGIDFEPGTNVVDVYMNYLRNKIDKPFEQKLLHTLIGQGFILKENVV